MNMRMIRFHSGNPILGLSLELVMGESCLSSVCEERRGAWSCWGPSCPHEGRRCLKTESQRDTDAPCCPSPDSACPKPDLTWPFGKVTHPPGERALKECKRSRLTAPERAQRKVGFS